jgi:hypothetical protein
VAVPDYVHAHFAKYPLPGPVKGWAYNVRPAIICKDGFVISVQASASGHYCSPKNDTGPYSTVEVLKGGKKLFKTESFVPVRNVNRRIHRHGGAV